MRIVCPMCERIDFTYKIEGVYSCQCGVEIIYNFRKGWHTKLKEGILNKNKINVIKAIRALCDCGLKDAKKVSDIIMILYSDNNPKIED